MTLDELATWTRETRTSLVITHTKRRGVFVVSAKKGPYYDLLRVENENLETALAELQVRVDAIRANKKKRTS